MTPLRDRLSRLIAASGPIPVSEYMALCLFDPEHGYYTTREPFGARGDFITAPEISQMFGELIGIWLFNAWTALGEPVAPVIAEIGPGRGTLMADATRTLTRLAPHLARQARFALVETSPRLAEIQKRTLGETPLSFSWHETVDDLPDGPLLIVGNELFDAIPLRQFVKTPQGWRERMVGSGGTDMLRFEAGTAGLDRTLLPPDAADAPIGSIFETAPAREAMMRTICERLARFGGAGLFIDYGHAASAVGDTFQALKHHEPVDPLAEPGLADLTSHVDFAALATAARDAGLGSALMTQGDFLLSMGLLERAGSLGAGRELQERLSGEVERLAAPDQMGTLFKAMLVAAKGSSLHPFAPAD